MLPLQTSFLAETSANALGEKLAQLKHTWLQLFCADCRTVRTRFFIQSFFLVLSLNSSVHKLRSPWATCQNSTESPIATEMSIMCIYLISCSWHGQRHKQYKTEFHFLLQGLISPIYCKDLQFQELQLQTQRLFCAHHRAPIYNKNHSKHLIPLKVLTYSI